MAALKELSYPCVCLNGEDFIQAELFLLPIPDGLNLTRRLVNRRARIQFQPRLLSFFIRFDHIIEPMFWKIRQVELYFPFRISPTV
jgi:hypothetical protein